MGMILAFCEDSEVEQEMGEKERNRSTGRTQAE